MTLSYKQLVVYGKIYFSLARFNTDFLLRSNTIHGVILMKHFLIFIFYVFYFEFNLIQSTLDILTLHILTLLHYTSLHLQFRFDILTNSI